MASYGTNPSGAARAQPLPPQMSVLETPRRTATSRTVAALATVCVAVLTFLAVHTLSARPARRYTVDTMNPLGAVQPYGAASARATVGAFAPRGVVRPMTPYCGPNKDECDARCAKRGKRAARCLRLCERVMCGELVCAPRKAVCERECAVAHADPAALDKCNTACKVAMCVICPTGKYQACQDSCGTDGLCVMHCIVDGCPNKPTA